MAGLPEELNAQLVKQKKLHNLSAISSGLMLSELFKKVNVEEETEDESGDSE